MKPTLHSVLSIPTELKASIIASHDTDMLGQPVGDYYKMPYHRQIHYECQARKLDGIIEDYLILVEAV